MKTQIIIFAILMCSTHLFAQEIKAEYEYDALNRLVVANYDNGKTVIYAYDKVGNRYSQSVNATDIKDVEKTDAGIKIYPNPATDNLTVRFEESEYKQAIILIRDVNGRTILTKPITEITNGTTKTINVSSLVTGNYFISIIAENKVIACEKIVITE